MAQWNMLYDMYERRLKAELSDAAVPAHIGVILDGNRRWAKSLGATASQGHRAGAGKISEFLQWSDDAGVSIVTLWLLSTDNLSRDAAELGELPSRLNTNEKLNRVPDQRGSFTDSSEFLGAREQVIIECHSGSHGHLHIQDSTASSII